MSSEVDDPKTLEIKNNNNNNNLEKWKPEKTEDASEEWGKNWLNGEKMCCFSDPSLGLHGASDSGTYCHHSSGRMSASSVGLREETEPDSGCAASRAPSLF